MACSPTCHGLYLLGVPWFRPIAIVCDCFWWIFWLTFMDKPAWYAKCFSFLTLVPFCRTFSWLPLAPKITILRELYQNHFQTIQSSSQVSSKKTSATVSFSHFPELPDKSSLKPPLMCFFFGDPFGESLTDLKTARFPTRYLDVSGWDSSQAKFEPCDVGEVAGHYAYGSWSGNPSLIKGKMLIPLR